MRQTGGPKRLPHILQAIEDLGDIKGSSAKRIIDQVDSTHYGSTERPKNLTGDVRKALKYAVDNGLVKERAGKFSVASFYGTSRLSGPSKSIYECRRRRKRKGQKRRRRHRRHASLSSLSDSEASLTGDEWESDGDVSPSRSRSRSPQFTGAIITHRRRRRRREKSRRGRRGRRGRRHALDEPETAPVKKDGRCLAHHQQDCDSPGCQRGADDVKHGSYIN